MYKKSSPFKPIKIAKDDPYIDFMNEEAEKSIQEMRAEQEQKVDENFKPQLKEPPAPPAPPTEKYSLHMDAEDMFVTQKRWSKLVAGLYLDVFNADKSLADISVEIKNIMNRNGIEVNTDDVDKLLESTQDRMLRIFLAKNMCLSLGMHREWDSEILSRELDLLYPERPLLGSSTTNKNKV